MITSRKSGTIETEGFKLNYTMEGSGKPVLVIGSPYLEISTKKSLSSARIVLNTRSPHCSMTLCSIGFAISITSNPRKATQFFDNHSRI
jgi:hypothetical protein